MSLKNCKFTYYQYFQLLNNMSFFDWFTNNAKRKEEGAPSIVELASSFNMAHNMNNPSAGQLASKLYNEVGPQRLGGGALIQLESTDCQCVGLAFTSIALCYNFNDEDVNSVAAENAYYCLARCLHETNNTFVAPAIFSLMQNGAKLLADKLISSWCNMAQKQTGIPIGIMLGGNPFRDPRLSDFREQAIGFKEYISYYALLKFFNVQEHKYLIPTDMPYFIPNESTINSFLKKNHELINTQKGDFVSKCKDHFLSVYEECKDTLMKY